MLPRWESFVFATLTLLLPTILAVNSKPTPTPGANAIPMAHAAIANTVPPGRQPYTVYGRIKIKSQEVKTVQDLLSSFHPKDGIAVELVSDIDLGIAFWYAQLSPDQVATVKKSSLVRSRMRELSDGCVLTIGFRLQQWLQIAIHVSTHCWN